jgi:hypothetical protein
MTKIAFRKNSAGDIIAFFPEDYQWFGNIMSYTANGGFNSCWWGWVDKLQPATKEEYQYLLQRVIAEGYKNLEIIE